MNLYDEGLYLTLTAFTSLERLPYRDLWTLYGPGPPLLGALVTNLFGEGLIVLRLVQAVAPLALTAAVYLFTVRFVPWWLATTFAVAVSTFAQPPHHFAEATAFVLIGFVFIDRALVAEDTSRRVRSMTVGAIVLGLAFLGRYEFVLVGLGVLGLAWISLWWSGHRSRARPLVWGLLGPAVFLFYLVAIVGWRVARVNLVDYPFGAYPDHTCRGIPTPWGQAMSSLVAPLKGRWWSGHELMLGLGTYGPPVLALLLGWLGLRSRDNARRLVMALTTAALVLFVWLEMRPRAGGSPQAVWPYLLAGLAVWVGSFRRHSWALTAKMVTAIVLLVTVGTSWPSSALEAWASWPTYDPKFGYANLRDTQLYDANIWTEVVRDVQGHSDSGEPVLVALINNTGHFANAPLLYWLVDRPPGTRFIEFNPCLTDTASIQRDMIEELDDTDVVILTSFYPNNPPPSGPTHILDEYLVAHFALSTQTMYPPPEPGGYQQEIHVLVRSEPG